MDPEQARKTAERDQLWASLRALRPEIERLAAGEFEFTEERERKIAILLARIVAAEMDFRAEESTTD